MHRTYPIAATLLSAFILTMSACGNRYVEQSRTIHRLIAARDLTAGSTIKEDDLQSVAEERQYKQLVTPSMIGIPEHPPGDDLTRPPSLIGKRLIHNVQSGAQVWLSRDFEIDADDEFTLHYAKYTCIAGRQPAKNEDYWLVSTELSSKARRKLLTLLHESQFRKSPRSYDPADFKPQAEFVSIELFCEAPHDAAASLPMPMPMQAPDPQFFCSDIPPADERLIAFIKQHRSEPSPAPTPIPPPTRQ